MSQIGYALCLDFLKLLCTFKRGRINNSRVGVKVEQQTGNSENYNLRVMRLHSRWSRGYD